MPSYHPPYLPTYSCRISHSTSGIHTSLIVPPRNQYNSRSSPASQDHGHTLKQSSLSDHPHPIGDGLPNNPLTYSSWPNPPSLPRSHHARRKIPKSRLPDGRNRVREQVKSDAHTRTSPPCFGSRAMTGRAGALPLSEGPGRWLSRLGRAEGNYFVDAVLWGMVLS